MFYLFRDNLLTPHPHTRNTAHPHNITAQLPTYKRKRALVCMLKDAHMNPRLCWPRQAGSDVGLMEMSGHIHQLQVKCCDGRRKGRPAEADPEAAAAVPSPMAPETSQAIRRWKPGAFRPSFPSLPHLPWNVIDLCETPEFHSFIHSRTGSERPEAYGKKTLIILYSFLVQPRAHLRIRVDINKFLIQN